MGEKDRRGTEALIDETDGGTVATRLKDPVSQLRPLREHDLLQVSRIEREAYSDPWPLDSFRDCLEFGHSCWVLAGQGVVQAYGIMSIELDSAHVLNLCVSSRFRRQGMGRSMLNHLVQAARTRDVESIFLEVRASNLAAIHLYRSAGFVEIGVRKGYYPSRNGREDALIFVLRDWRISKWRTLEGTKRS